MSAKLARSGAVAALAAAILSATPLPAAAIVSYGASIGAPLYMNPTTATRPFVWRYALTPLFYAPTIIEPASAHVAWCMARYRSYDVVTGTYRRFDGERRACVSPY
jgi:hypothetical protein